MPHRFLLLSLANLPVSPRFPIHDMLGYDAQAGRLWMSLVDVGSPKGFEPTANLGCVEHLINSCERAEVELRAPVKHRLEKLHLYQGCSGKCSYFLHFLFLVVFNVADGEVPTS